MKLIADSGSTKTDWCVMDGSRVVQRMAGQGINPFQQSPPVILKNNNRRRGFKDYVCRRY